MCGALLDLLEGTHDPLRGAHWVSRRNSSPANPSPPPSHTSLLFSPSVHPHRLNFFSSPKELSSTSYLNSPDGYKKIKQERTEADTLSQYHGWDRPEFQSLLQRAEEEFGIKHGMGLTSPCEEVVFRSLTEMIR
ncbi:hypothetical protein NC653_018173 [Populus alba x Populus x berolinensis]|uniref:Uncharacterized protein n=1 Tax=Populus alba x Populus x berolinensis TaxID=444605 RepID=A0AAD6VUG0_9ROSI|nr:hypothetical protein NC653_018173 [Populus alba x Populus x berolinensis]